MSDSPNLPLNLSEIENDMGHAVSNFETLASNTGTVIAHGFEYGMAEAKPIVESADLDFHARILKIEAFVTKLEERMRALRFW